MNAYHVRGRYVYIILACMLTKTVCTQSLSSYAKWNYLSSLRNLRIMHLQISNFRYQYSHAVSTLPLHNTYTLCSCASYSSEHKKPPVYTTPPVAACLTFLLSTCHSYQIWFSQDRTMNITASSFPSSLTPDSRYFPILCLRLRNPLLWTASRTRAN